MSGAAVKRGFFPSAFAHTSPVRFRSRLLILVFLMILPITLILNLYYFIQIRSLITDQAAQAAGASAATAAFTFELRIRSAIGQAQNLLMDRYMDEYRRTTILWSPDQYAQLDAVPKERAAEIYGASILKSRILERLSLFPNMDPAIRSAHIYDRKYRSFIELRGISIVESDPSAPPDSMRIGNPAGSIPISRLRSIQMQSGQEYPIFSSKASGLDDRFTVIVTFDAAAAVLGLRETSGISKDAGRSAVYVAFPDGGLLLAEAGEEPIVRSALAADDGQAKKIVTIGSRSYFHERRYSSILDLWIGVLLDANPYFSRLTIILVLMAVLALACVAGFGYAGSVYARRLYRPIESLAARIGSAAGLREGEGELDFISNRIDALLNDGMRRDALLEANLPLYKDQLLRSILSSKPTGSRGELQERFEFFKVRVRPEALVVAMLNIHGSNLRDEDAGRISDAYEVITVIRNAIHTAIADAYPVEFIALGEEKEAALVGVEEIGRNDFIVFLNRIVDDMGSRFPRTLTIGVGRWSPTIDTAWESCREAADQLKLRMVYGDGNVFDIQDGRGHSADGSDAFPSETEREAVLAAIKKGEPGTAVDHLRALAESLRSGAGSANPEKVSAWWFALLSSILEALRDALPPDSGTRGGNNPYHSLARLESFDEIVAWFEALIREGSARVADARSGYGTKQLETLLRLVEDNCDVTVNLTTAADAIGLNPSYLSRLFKEKTGISFIEHLTELRMKKAAMLLGETRKNLDEIANKVGYTNPNYFISVFRKRFGKSPAEYRRSLDADRYHP